jgi:hypothetical protein
MKQRSDGRRRFVMVICRAVVLFSRWSVWTYAENGGLFLCRSGAGGGGGRGRACLPCILAKRRYKIIVIVVLRNVQGYGV